MDTAKADYIGIRCGECQFLPQITHEKTRGERRYEVVNVLKSARIRIYDQSGGLGNRREARRSDSE